MRILFIITCAMCLFCNTTAQAATNMTTHKAPPQQIMRQDSVISTGSGGYMGTWTDPQTGDKVTAVIAPPRQVEQQTIPIYIYPPRGHGGHMSPYSDSGTTSGTTSETVSQ